MEIPLLLYSCPYWLMTVSQLSQLWLLSQVVSQLNCCRPLPAQSFLASGLVHIYDQDFCSLLGIYVFSSGASSLMREGVGFSVYVLYLLHHSFSMSISMLSQHPADHGLCAPFVTALCYVTFIQNIQRISVNVGLCCRLYLNFSTILKLVSQLIGRRPDRRQV
jgi:hypothetical protein